MSMLCLSRSRRINTRLRDELPRCYVKRSLTYEPLYQIGHQKQDHRAQRRCDNSADNASAQR